MNGQVPTHSSVPLIEPVAAKNTNGRKQTSKGVQPVTSVGPDLVTLDQAAATVHRAKRTLERYKTNGTLPDAVVEGGGGKFSLWDWRIPPALAHGEIQGPPPRDVPGQPPKLTDI